ncbi:PepSY-like domain-containing protein [Flavobacterium rakeshii]|uniref:PepSY-like domain-containing protein n=1 Tax=Flavobacterium rakeshii TaxID=1038845 RepID=UPI002E7B3BF1|nr:PepSY-like domain-containing protein [Flavobacterium rakeshii]MEE1897159.1 PepSY-like domain-containing protein [Flavobacterium rakeshii]
METLLRLSTLLIILFTVTAFGQERKITLNDLPPAAKTFISQNFPNQAPSYVIEDKDIRETEYEVVMTGGVEMEFDAKGNCKEIDGNGFALPDTVLPKVIMQYIRKNYKGQGVEKAEKKRWGYEVELLNDLELEFDNNGKFLRLDD